MSTMRNLYVTLSFVMVSGMLSAQNQYTKTADKLFNRYEYVDAAKEYLKLALCDDKKLHYNYKFILDLKLI